MNEILFSLVRTLLLFGGAFTLGYTVDMKLIHYIALLAIVIGSGMSALKIKE
ncbi:hypothetical protein MKZ18_06495 [Priestia sp. FSL W8-0001]|uniref:hypothetical protein n=1 Tax=unclassified Priestia TaxID=2800374 RepID=UPI0030F9DFB1